jgi:HSP20 family molecular chaperone IbpA
MVKNYRDPLKDMLDTFFDRPSLSTTRENSTKLVTRDNEYAVYFSVPGLTKDDLKISIKDGYLSISFKKEDGDNVNYSFVSSFSKTYSIPDDVNEKEITGKVENGILEINLPKSKKKSLERFISLN